MLPRMILPIARKPLIQYTVLNTLSAYFASGTSKSMGNLIVPEDGFLVISTGGNYISNAQRTISSCTVDGVLTTLFSQSPAGYSSTALFGIPVTAGSRAIVFSLNSSAGGPVYASGWLLKNLTSTTPSATGSTGGGTGGTTSRSFNVSPLAGNLSLFSLSHWNSGTVTWTGATESFDIDGSDNGMSGAAFQPSTNQVGTTITATFANGSSGMVYATFV